MLRSSSLKNIESVLVTDPQAFNSFLEKKNLCFEYLNSLLPKTKLIL